MSLSDFAVVAGAALLLLSRFTKQEKITGYLRFGAYGLFSAVVVNLLIHMSRATERMSQELQIHGPDQTLINANLWVAVIYGLIAVVLMLYFGVTGSDPSGAVRSLFRLTRRAGTVSYQATQPVYGQYVMAAVLGMMALLGVGVVTALVVLAQTPRAQLAAYFGNPLWAAAIMVSQRVPGTASWLSAIYLLGPPLMCAALGLALLARKNWARRMASALFGTLALGSVNALLIAVVVGSGFFPALLLTFFFGWGFWYLNQPKLVAYFEERRNSLQESTSRSASASG